MIRRNRHQWWGEDICEGDEIEIPSYDVTSGRYEAEWDQWTISWTDERVSPPTRRFLNVGEANATLQGFTNLEKRRNQIFLNQKVWKGEWCHPRDQIAIRWKKWKQERTPECRSGQDRETKEAPRDTGPGERASGGKNFVWLTAPDGKFVLEKEEFDRKFEEFSPLIRKGILHVKVNGQMWKGSEIHLVETVLVYTTGPGGCKYLMDEPRPIFGLERLEEGTRYARFWLQGKLCDAYLRRWTVEELVQLVTDRSGYRDLRLWRDQEPAEGSISWEEETLRMVVGPDPPPDYPRLWKWELEWNHRQMMLISPELPIMDARTSIQRQWEIPRTFFLKTRSQYTDIEHEVMKNECTDGMNIRISMEPAIQEDLKTVMIHHEGKEFILEVANMNHLDDRLRTAFPEWWNLPDKRIGQMSLNDAQTGEEMWLIRGEDW
jgi:hypothetical protein